MTITPSPVPSSRRLACARCGTSFECSLNGGCWCDAESYKLPMPNTVGEDCLCPACLRKAALQHTAEHP